MRHWSPHCVCTRVVVGIIQVLLELCFLRSEKSELGLWNLLKNELPYSWLLSGVKNRSHVPKNRTILQKSEKVPKNPKNTDNPRTIVHMSQKHALGSPGRSFTRLSPLRIPLESAGNEESPEGKF